MNLQLTLAFRYLRGRKLRTMLTTLAIVFGVLVIFGMNTLIPAFTRAFQANALAAAGQVDATITLKTGDAFAAATADAVAAVPGVRLVSPMLVRTVNVPPDYFDADPTVPDSVSALSLVGIDVGQATGVHSYVVEEGRFLADGDGPSAVIGRRLADVLGLRLGGRLSLPTTQGEAPLTVVGILSARPPAAIEEVLVTLPQAQSLLGMPAQINTLEANFDALDPTRRAEIQAAVLATLGDAFQVGSLASNSDLLTSMNTGQAVFNLLGVLALLMGAFIIFNTFRTIVAERRHDIGMLRALGASRATIIGMIVSEGLLQGLAGTGLGLALGYLFGLGFLWATDSVVRQFLNISLGAPVVTPALVIGSAVIGMGVTLMAGVVPAISASRLTPLEALRPTLGTLSLRRMAGLGFWSGMVMLAMAVAALLSGNVGLIGVGGVLFVLGLILSTPALVNPIANLFGALLAILFARGGTAQLAEGNLSRQPTRAAVTASTTLIGMAILVMAATVMSSVYVGFGRVLRKSLGSDFVLLPPSLSIWGTNVGAGESLAEDLRSVNGVSVVSSMRFAPSQIDGLALSVMGIDPATYPKVSGLTFAAGDETAAYSALAEGRALIVNPVLAMTARVEMGQALELLTPNGRQTYLVAAIGGDYLNAKLATAYVSNTWIETDFNRYEDVLLLVGLAPDADRRAAEARLREIATPYPQFRLISTQEFIDQNLRLFDAGFAGLYALVLFLAVPSLIAMVNTLAIGVIERRREIGMVRAVGASRRQVGTIIVAEALILAALGTGFGVLSGLYLGYMGVEAFRAAGFPMEYVFPASGALLAVAAGVLFGVLAALIPARQAARLEIVQALRYE